MERKKEQPRGEKEIERRKGGKGRKMKGNEGNWSGR